MEKNRGGRPRKNDSEKRTHVVLLRVSEKEYGRLKEAAIRRKMTVVRLIREHLWAYSDD